ncbi:fimbrial protein [Burkholderia pyrrocinia]|uniref:fimbrial protein n=1 Tax=Burkholderia pyrrocinia TaxID=60550 RepID=UPI001269E575|nr:fimbrial protein [Burkholderia pyrrocinia]
MTKIESTPTRAIASIVVAFTCAMGAPSVIASRCYIDKNNGAKAVTETVTFSEAAYVRDTVIGTKTTTYARPLGTGSTLQCDCVESGATNACLNNLTVSSSATVVGGEPVPGYSNTYKTGIDGIGIRFFAVPFGSSNTVMAPFVKSAPNKPSANWFNAAAQLVVTGPIRGGTSSSLPSLQVRYLTSGEGAEPLDYTLNIAGPISIISKACKVANPEINVNLPTVVYSKIQSPGATAAETGFSINLTDCPDGISIYATMTDASDPTNVSTTLKLAPESTARGVGYQLLFGGKPIAFGPDSSAPGTPNQFLVQTPATPSFSIPLSARYVRTAEAFAPGSVVGRVTFNMSYQ